MCRCASFHEPVYMYIHATCCWCASQCTLLLGVQAYAWRPWCRCKSMSGSLLCTCVHVVTMHVHMQAVERCYEDAELHVEYAEFLMVSILQSWRRKRHVWMSMCSTARSFMFRFAHNGLETTVKWILCPKLVCRKAAAKYLISSNMLFCVIAGVFARLQARPQRRGDAIPFFFWLKHAYCKYVWTKNSNKLYFCCSICISLQVHFLFVGIDISWCWHMHEQYLTSLKLAEEQHVLAIECAPREPSYSESSSRPKLRFFACSLLEICRTYIYPSIMQCKYKLWSN